MDIGTITSLIGSFGFPIVCCLAMGWFVKYQMDENNEQIKSMTQEHKTEMSEVTTALNNNTLAIQKLCERLTGYDNDESE